jgi:hypothetical protein
VAAAFTVSMSRWTNDEAPLSCKSLGRRAPTRAACMTCQRDSPHAAFSKVPVRHALDKPPSELLDTYRLSAGTVWPYRKILAVNEVP